MQSDPSESPDHRAPRPPGRFRAAWSVLRGRSLVPEDLRFEWLEYQAVFNDLLQRYSAQLARAAKSEKARIKALSDVLDPPVASRPVPRSHKAELRARAAALKGLGVPSRTYEAPSYDQVPPPLAPEKEP